MCKEHDELEAVENVLKIAYQGVVERLEAGIASTFRSRCGLGVIDYRSLCYNFIERVEFPEGWNRLDQIKFFGDIMQGERDETGVIVV